jgi:hypothetical protein
VRPIDWSDTPLKEIAVEGILIRWQYCGIEWPAKDLPVKVCTAGVCVVATTVS